MTTQYSINLDVLFNPLEHIDVNDLVETCKENWYNQTLCEVNESVVRLGILQGEFHWHKHDNEDEFFFVLDGKLFIEVDDRVIELTQNQGFTVPKGVMHRTSAPERTVVLMIEKVGVVPTGDQ